MLAPSLRERGQERDRERAMKERNRVIVVDSLGVIRSTPTIVRSFKKMICAVLLHLVIQILLFLRYRL